MSPVAISGVDKQGVDVNGVQVKQALSAANSTVNKGVYAATLLETVDGDLAVANIKSGVTIFGVAGTVVGGVETIEKYADATIANAASYTPAASGIFFLVGNNQFSVQYYTTVGGGWIYPKGYKPLYGAMAIGGGTKFRIRNESGGDAEYCLMRHYYSTGTYERETDSWLAAGASYTPAGSGVFASASDGDPVQIQINETTAGWVNAAELTAIGDPLAIVVGDGVNLRLKNTHGITTYFNLVMRAKLT